MHYLQIRNKSTQRAFTGRIAIPRDARQRLARVWSQLQAGMAFARRAGYGFLYPHDTAQAAWDRLERTLRARWPDVPAKAWKYARDWSCSRKHAPRFVPLTLDWQSFGCVASDATPRTLIIAAWRTKFTLHARDAWRHVSIARRFVRLRVWRDGRHWYATVVYEPQTARARQRAAPREIAIHVDRRWIATSDGAVWAMPRAHGAARRRDQLRRVVARVVKHADGASAVYCSFLNAHASGVYARTPGQLQLLRMLAAAFERSGCAFVVVHASILIDSDGRRLCEPSADAIARRIAWARAVIPRRSGSRRQ